MATARHDPSPERRERAGRTTAQMFCLIVGGGLVAVGILGFIFAGTGFETGNNVQGDEFILFEVNGWHNLVHIATGALLLFAAPVASAAAATSLIFGAAYAVVTVWGFVDGNDVANLIPVNTADNLLHAALAGLGLAVGLGAGGAMASGREERRERPATTTRGRV